MAKSEAKFVNAKGELKAVKTLAFDDEGNEIIRVNKLDAGSKLIVKTKNSTYKITVVDPIKGDLLIQGGKRWQEETAVGFSGSTWGGSMLFKFGLGVGLYMELCPDPPGPDDKRWVTSAVKSIEILDS